MEYILSFLEKYYLVFDCIALFLIFSMIGYFAVRKKEKLEKFKIDNQRDSNDIEVLENKINTNISLQELVKENKNIKNNESNNI